MINRKEREVQVQKQANSNVATVCLHGRQKGIEQKEE